MKIWAAKQSWVSKKANAKAKLLDQNNVKKIAVIKHAALGDMIQARPMLIALREAFPNAQLTLSVVTHYMHGIPEDLIDNLHVAKGNEKKYSFKEIRNSFKDLGYQDIIFDISATSRSFWITKLNPAGLKVGYMHKGLHRLLYDVAIPRAHYRFEGETFLEQVNVIGIQNDWPLRYDYPMPDKVHEKNYIVYFPTASVMNKCWPPEYMSELIIKMSNEYPHIDHILLSGLAEWENEVAQSIAGNVGDCSNFKFIKGGASAFSVIAHADILISSDTGLRHIAIAANTATVCLFPEVSHAFGYLPLFGQHKAIIAEESNPAPVSKVSEAINNIISSR